MDYSFCLSLLIILTLMLDLRTLMVALIVMFAIQAALLITMSVALKAYRGLRLWAIACILLTLYLVLLFFQKYGVWENFFVISTNLSALSTFLFFYFGAKNLLNLPVKTFIPLVLSSIFMALIAYFTFISNQLNIRIELFSVMSAFILIKIGTMMIVHHKKSFRSSALILASLFLILGVLFLIRAINTMIHTPENDLYFQTNSMQALTFLFSICICFVWCIGVIMLVNQKLYGELKEKTEELKSSNVDKDKFFSILAHDLRGPMATIESMIDLMTDIKYDIDEKQHLAMTLAMKKSVHSTNILLDNLLDWASMQSGLRTIHRVETTYGKMMVPVMPVLQAQANNKHITIKEQIPAETLLTADPKMVQSVFRNLVANAIKFTPTNGTILLKANTTEDGTIVFSISDNGIGMDEGLMENLFNKGSSGLRLGTNGETSTGLGLMICKEFIEKHGGKIWIESKVNQGSTFYFSLDPTS